MPSPAPRWMLPSTTRPPRRKRLSASTLPVAMSLGVTKNATLSVSADSTRPLAPPSSTNATTTRIRRCRLRRRMGSLGRGAGELRPAAMLRHAPLCRPQLRPARPRRTREAAYLLELRVAAPGAAPALHQERDQHHRGKAVGRPDVSRYPPMARSQSRRSRCLFADSNPRPPTPDRSRHPATEARPPRESDAVACADAWAHSIAGRPSSAGTR